MLHENVPGKQAGRLHRGITVSYSPITELHSSRLLGMEAVMPGARRRGGPDRRDGGWLMMQACAAAAGWPAGSVAVDVTAAQLHGGLVLRHVATALEHSGLTPERLELELSETLLDDVDLDTLLTLSVIRDLGVGLVLDDFGTGHASLRMLKRLPLTGLKLDASLVRTIPEEADDAAIARAVIAAAHALRLDVTACGLEREPQRAALAGYGCDAGQGELFA